MHRPNPKETSFRIILYGTDWEIYTNPYEAHPREPGPVTEQGYCFTYSPEIEYGVSQILDVEIYKDHFIVPYSSVMHIVMSDFWTVTVRVKSNFRRLKLVK